jgi:hypothetical protein
MSDWETDSNNGNSPLPPRWASSVGGEDIMETTADFPAADPSTPTPASSRRKTGKKRASNPPPQTDYSPFPPGTLDKFAYESEPEEAAWIAFGTPSVAADAKRRRDLRRAARIATPSKPGPGLVIQDRPITLDNVPPPVSPSPPFPWEEFFKTMEFASTNIDSQPKAIAFSRIALNYIFRSVRQDKTFGTLIFDGDNVSIGSVIGEVTAILAPPAAPTSVPQPPPQTGMKVDPLPVAPKPAPKPKGPTLPKPRPAAKADGAPAPKRPPPKAAPSAPVPTAAAPPRRRSAPHTTHGLTCRGIYLSPPADNAISAANFNHEVINDFNRLIASDLKRDLVITAAHPIGGGIHLNTARVPQLDEVAFVLKHVRRYFPSTGNQNIDTITPLSTSYLKVMDVPISPGSPKDWAKLTSEAFSNSLSLSPVGIELAKELKHKPRIMRISPHSDSCVAWVDIHGSVSGRKAASLIGKFIPIGGINCRIVGAKPHSGSTFCTRCQRWGHHHSQCRSLGVRCPLCGGPHHQANHFSSVKPERALDRRCVNCASSKKPSSKHAATDHKCPFWQNRFDRAWLARQFKRG